MPHVSDGAEEAVFLLNALSAVLRACPKEDLASLQWQVQKMLFPDE